MDLPGPLGDSSILRESMWFEFGVGDDEPPVPAWALRAEPSMDAHVPPPPLSAGLPDGKRRPLPLGTAALLERASYPDGRVAGAPALLDRIGTALVASFGVQWHDPANPYNVHRCYASPRCLYPVQVFLDDGERWNLLDLERHTLVEMPGAAHGPCSRRRLALTGRYTRIPRGYKWFRGSLVNMELGIMLRSLSIGLELVGLSSLLRLPDARSHDLLTQLGLDPTSDFSLPLIVELGAGEPEPTTAAPQRPSSDHPPDEVLADIVRINRVQDFREPPAPLGTGIPADAASPSSPMSWAELLWQRNSGRTLRGMRGMSGKRHRLPGAAVRDMCRWLSVPPPGPTLAAVGAAVTLTVVLQAVDGHTDGIYRVRDGEITVYTEDPTAARRLEVEYGYPLTPNSACDIRHASAIWFLTVRPRELAALFGPGGWSAAQYVSGWAVHGLCLSACAAGLFARPVRAFNEIPTQRILGLEPDEMIALAAVVGTPRHTSGSLLDIRL